MSRPVTESTRLVVASVVVNEKQLKSSTAVAYEPYQYLYSDETRKLRRSLLMVPADDFEQWLLDNPHAVVSGTLDLDPFTMRRALEQLGLYNIDWK